jgi:preprotein translocase subunit YajC
MRARCARCRRRPKENMAVLALIQSAGSSMIGTLVPMAVIIAIFYFMVIAPANKQRKKTESMLEALKKGDRVITTGGIYGTVQSVEGDAVYLRIAENVKIKVAKSAVAALVNDEPAGA